MIDIRVARTVVNTDSLDALLRAELGETCCGFSIDSDGIRVHLLLDTPDTRLEAQAWQLVMSYVDTLPEPVATMPVSTDQVVETKEGAFSIEDILRRMRAMEEHLSLRNDL